VTVHPRRLPTSARTARSDSSQPGGPLSSDGSASGAPPLTLTDVLLLAVVTAGVLLPLLALYPLRGFRLPIGADSSVYLWWSRLAAHDGLSAVGFRPGLPTVGLLLSGTLHVPLPQVLGGLGATLSATLAAASAALLGMGSVRARKGSGSTSELRHERRWSRGGWRLTWALGAILSGAFTVHLADGYFANLAYAGLFIAAAGLLAAGSPTGDSDPGRLRRAGTAPRTTAAAAAALLGASGLIHPLFFLVGAAILATAAVISVIRQAPGTPVRATDAPQIGGALAGGAVLAGCGLLSLLSGAPPLRVDTSRDAVLRRSGLGSALRAIYADRLARHWARYVLPVAVPLSLWGTAGKRGRPFLQRLLVGWWVVLVAGVIVTTVFSGLAPAVRVIAFGYVLPLGAAIGLVLLWDRLAHRGRLLAAAVVVVLTAAMLAGAWITWLRARPYVAGGQVRAATLAGRMAEATTPPGTPLVFVVYQRTTAAFLPVVAGNTIRAAVPPGRIRDVYLYVGTPRDYLAGRPTLTGVPEHDAMSRLFLRDIQRAGGSPMAFVLPAFNPGARQAAAKLGTRVAPGVFVLDTGRPVKRAPALAAGELPVPTLPWRFVLVGVSCFLLLVLIGLGWSTAATGWGFGGVALAPAFGIAALVIGGIALERLGAPLTGAGPRVISAGVAVCGYALSYWRRRRRVREDLPGSEPTTQIAQ